MKHDEQKSQFDLVEFIRYQYPNILFTISPGGLLTSSRVGGKAKKLGYNPGVPDLIIFEPRGKYHGLFIELKAEKGIISDVQKGWLLKLKSSDYYAVVCFNFNDAVQVLREYLALKKYL